MGETPSQTNSGGTAAGKKAGHVKWAGKTIALGTFPAAEADSKCAQAKALTRAWRSTMQPRPSREWVMAELERLGIRIVNGRKNTGKDDDDGDGEPSKDPSRFPLQQTNNSSNNNISGGGGAHSMMGGGPPSADAMYSSTGLPNDFSNGMNSSSIPPPHRPMVGGGAAAAYEAAREDHYKNLQEKHKNQQDAAKLNSSPGGPVGLSANHKQHYEMLKLHHMNLLKEIQETTLMMNVYQQQEERQREQEERQKKQAEALLMNGNGMHQHQGLGNQLNSLGFQGGSSEVQALIQHQQQQQMLSAMGNQGGMNNAALQQQIQSLKNEIALQQEGTNTGSQDQSLENSGGKRRTSAGEEKGLDQKRPKMGGVF
mmetsp:Transcript_17915/g.26518  ORF Transcript_17915/g.26518 Transcript_17915/m.26518 type:complete len:369 (-) Transcript_17915:450-1556(-)|eukprot:CAMPEP_0194211662 /NCGR_PEP_ID=MMETSP0156-20130528/10832_1 /TAXON_ID=33649 /ORGANISM="Thalassionema nitzschioides, Strain L26-B" /LENGTH=368 /DNA_ID=CAMNT_0038939283 /DNA_START=160 /DNA_END=1269 /DNA_ORIENTATION=-